MSINFNVANARYALQVADRRLLRRSPSGGWEFYTDQANKMTIHRCKDAYLSIAYHGLGEIHGQRTDLWLVDHLTEMGARQLGIQEVAETLADRSTEAFQRWWKNGSDPAVLRHSFMMTGWHRSESSFVYVVSNYELLDPIQTKDRANVTFTQQGKRVPPDKPRGLILVTGGAWEKIDPRDGQLINSIIRDPGADPRDVRNVIARAIRDASELDSRISAESMSAFIEHDRIAEKGELVAECAFHSEDGGPESFMPNQVQEFALTGIKISTEIGVQRWDITEKIPKGLSGARIRRALAKLPAKWKTGDKIPTGIDHEVEQFLESLPIGLSEDEIRRAL